MNRSQKILISIFSIIIMVLILIGITYAYFVTRVEGNTNNTSIIMTSADLRLVYGDGNGVIESYNIEPGENIDEKTFTVKNIGTNNINNYGIYLEDLLNDFTNNNDLIYSLTCTSNKSKSCNNINDQVFPNFNELLVTNSIEKDEIQTYSLKIKYLNINDDQSVDMRKTIKAKIQIYNIDEVVNVTGRVINYSDGDYIQIGNKKSQINHDGKYKVIGVPTTINTIYLKNSNDDIIGQKNITINRVTGVSSINSDIININNYGKIINIDVSKLENDISIDVNSVENYNKSIDGTLINKIFTNVSLDSSSTKLVNNPSVSFENVSSNEKELIPINDNYGVSYYYRGNVIDNFLNYKGMCFRIVRIEGDGSIKVILADKDNICNGSSFSLLNQSSSLIGTSNFGQDEYKMPKIINNDVNSLYNKLSTWFNENFRGEENKLKNDTWCLGNMDKKYSLSSYELTNNKDYLFENSLRIINNSPSLLCGSSSQKYQSYISSLTSDELMLAGLNTSNISTSYILNNASTNNWWTISSSTYQNEITSLYVVSNKKIGQSYVNSENYIRPVIVFDSRIYATGDGTQSNPYEIN